MTNTSHSDQDRTPQTTGPHRFALDEWISCAPFERLLKIRIVHALKGRAILKMPFLLDFAQGAGLMHGGALVSLADTAMVMAIKSLIAPHTHFATTFMESRFHHPVRQGVVTAEARVTEHEDTLLKCHANVLDDSDRSVATFNSTYKIARDAAIKSVHFKDK